jgi:hypothetical protein
LKLSKEDEESILNYIQYYITSFMDKTKLTDYDRKIILKVFIYKKKKEEIEKYIKLGQSVKKLSS